MEDRYRRETAGRIMRSINLLIDNERRLIGMQTILDIEWIVLHDSLVNMRKPCGFEARLFMEPVRNAAAIRYP